MPQEFRFPSAERLEAIVESWSGYADLFQKAMPDMDRTEARMLSMLALMLNELWHLRDSLETLASSTKS